MTNINPAAFIGVVLLVVVICGLLYIFYSRTNAVEKTGAGSLIMLSVVALMIPVFWIMEAGNETSSQKQLFAYGVTQGRLSISPIVQIIVSASLAVKWSILHTMATL